MLSVVLSACYPRVIRVLSACYPRVIRALSACYPRAIRVLSVASDLATKLRATLGPAPDPTSAPSTSTPRQPSGNPDCRAAATNCSICATPLRRLS